MSARETSLSDYNETASLLVECSSSQYDTYEDLHRSNAILKSTGAESTTDRPLEVDRSTATVIRSSKGLNWKVKVARNSKRRIPKSKAVVLILVINVLQSFCFYTIVQSTVQTIIKTIDIPKNGLLIYDEDSKLQFFDNLVLGIQIGFPALFYPIGGILGDVYIGRRKISLICMFISFTSYVTLSFSLSIAYIHSTSSVFGIALPLLALLLISISNGVFNINWLTFGADQLINSPTDEVSGYIYYWYWTKNLGLFLATLTTSLLSFVPPWLSIENQIVSSIIPLISAVTISIAIFIDLYASSLYDRERNNANPVKQVLGVLCNALTSRPKRRPFMTAFRYGEDPPSGLDYARQYHDGKYTDEEVGDVKSCCRIFILVALISGFTAIYFAIQNRAEPELQGLHNISPIEGSMFILIDSCFILILVPFWSNIFFPLIGHYVPTTRKRVIIGILLGTFGTLTAGIINEVIPSYVDTDYPNRQLRSMLFFIPLLVTVIAESLVFISALEFIYAQSPDNMKGLLIGLHYFIIGLWATVSFVVLFNHGTDPQDDHEDTNKWRIYYFSYAGVGLLGCVLFAIVNNFYENRRRNNPISDIMRISSYYK